MDLNRFAVASLSLFVEVAPAGSISKGAGQANLTVGAARRRLTLRRRFNLGPQMVSFGRH